MYTRVYSYIKIECLFAVYFAAFNGIGDGGCRCVVDCGIGEWFVVCTCFYSIPIFFCAAVVYIGQVFATGKGAVANSGNTNGDSNACQACAIIKGPASNDSNAIGNGDTCQA